jgi:hypothetical protein
MRDVLRVQRIRSVKSAKVLARHLQKVNDMKARSVLIAFLFPLVSAVACGETTEPNSTARWAACTLNSECTLAAKSCCGVCGNPKLEDVDAVNEDYLDDHKRAVCPTPVVCAACPTQENPDLHATCGGGSCKAFDIRRDSVSACKSDDDCRLRVAGCCECGGSTSASDLIAINGSSESRYIDLVCDPEQACPACAPVYPEDVEARCASDGHCEVRTKASACLLPFDTGPCNAAMRVFAFVDGACVERTYGGCEGNDNRFASIEECMATCQGQPEPNGCPADRIRRSACLACGPAGGCSKQGDICAKTCAASSDCENPLGYCTNGACEAGGCI